MDGNIPRTAEWTGEIGYAGCFDAFGSYSFDEPMAVVFNIIPRSTPIPIIVNYLKQNGGLKASARCMGGHMGTVTTEAKRQVSLVMSDADVTRLLEDLHNKMYGFVIYDLKKTELFSSTALWNQVAENAPSQEGKFLFLALCFDFEQATRVLDTAVEDNHIRRWRLGVFTFLCFPCTLGLRCLICESFKKNYKLVNKTPYPRDMVMTQIAFGGIVMNK